MVRRFPTSPALDENVRAVRAILVDTLHRHAAEGNEFACDYLHGRIGMLDEFAGMLAGEDDTLSAIIADAPASLPAL